MIPTISREQMAKIDSLAVNHFGLETIQMMENAGRETAALARTVLGGVRGKTIVILAGKGNNGGDGLVAARFLHNRGAQVHVVMAAHPDELSQLVREQLGMLRAMYVSIIHPVDYLKVERLLQTAHLIVDALLGYNIEGDPRGNVRQLIEWATGSKNRILSIDLPSGLDPDTGRPGTPCIRAAWTLGLTLPKKGCVVKQAKDYVGTLYVADMGVPKEIYELMDLAVPILHHKRDILKYEW